MMKAALLALPLLAGCVPAYYGSYQTYQAPLAYQTASSGSWYSVQNNRGQTDDQIYHHEASVQNLLAQEVTVREAQQGPTVHKLNTNQCIKLMGEAPVDAFSRGDPAERGDNPYFTPQENYCVALYRSNSSPANNVYPGMLPENGRAVSTGNGNWWVHW